jgi:hypothetical protein
MHHNPEQPTDQHARAEDQNRESKRAPDVNKKPRVRTWIFWVTVSGLFAFFAQYVESFNHKFLFPSLVLVLVTVASAARALWVHLVNNGSSHRDAHLRSTAIVVCGTILCALMFWREREPPQPHLRLVLKGTSQDRFLNLQLTNSFLLKSESKLSLGPGDGFLIIPVSTNSTQISLTFAFINDSSLSIDSMQITLLIYKRILWAAGAGWQQVDELGDMKVASLPVGNLLTNAGTILPDITFLDVGRGIFDFCPIAFRVRANNMSPQTWCFWLNLACPDIPGWPQDPRRAPVVTKGRWDIKTGRVSLMFPLPSDNKTLPP